MGFQYLRNVVRDLELRFSPVSTMTPVSGPGGLCVWDIGALDVPSALSHPTG